MKAYVEIRSQKAKGTWPKSGPDRYVAIQSVPDGIEPLKVLNRKVAQLIGIKIIYCGQGYCNRTSDRSMYGQALEKAKRIAEEING